jgi:hypothetical protein
MIYKRMIALFQRIVKPGMVNAAIAEYQAEFSQALFGLQLDLALQYAWVEAH